MSKKHKSVRQEMLDEFELMLELYRIQDLLRVIILINLDPIHEERLKKIREILEDDDKTNLMMDKLMHIALRDALED